MAQGQLKWGSLVLCSPSNGLDGYAITEFNHTRTDVIERNLPGSAGRIAVITGKGSSDPTALKLGFRCQAVFSTESALNSFLANVNAEAQSTTNPLRTVYYSHMTDDTGRYQDDMDFQFALSQTWRSADGWGCDFRVLFTKWGAD